MWLLNTSLHLQTSCAKSIHCPDRLVMKWDTHMLPRSLWKDKQLFFPFNNFFLHRITLIILSHKGSISCSISVIQELSKNTYICAVWTKIDKIHCPMVCHRSKTTICQQVSLKKNSAASTVVAELWSI